ncbi:MAG: GntR family transcriptional regulator [Planctomycetota bacterium]|nr:GntR family transcriptional regulator [Planctomycetota bacterium]
MELSAPSSSDADADLGLDLKALAVPKWKSLQVYLERKIHGGAFAPENRLPTEKELMSQFGYSYGTVSRALRALAEAGVVERTRGRGTFVVEGRAAPAVSQSAARPDGQTLAFFHCRISPDFHPYYSALLDGFILAAGQHGMSMKFVTAPEGNVGVTENFLERHGIAGFACQHARPGEYRRALQFRIPVVDLTGWYPQIPLDRVVEDHGEELRMGFRHLLELGHKHVAFLGKSPWLSLGHELAEVFDCTPPNVPVPQLLVGGWSPEHARRAVERWKQLEPRPTGLFVADDFLLMNFMRELEAEGVAVPGELSVVGRGSSLSSQFIGQSMTMVEQDPLVVGRAAIELLVRQLNGAPPAGRVVRIPPVLVQRASTAPLGAGTAPAQPVISSRS